MKRNAVLVPMAMLVTLSCSCRGQDVLKIEELKPADKATQGEIIDTLENGDEVGKVLAAMYLYLQPEMKSPELFKPLLKALGRVRDEDKHILLRCIVRQGRPMLDHLLAELKGTPSRAVFLAIQSFGDQAADAVELLIPIARKDTSVSPAVLALGAIGKASLNPALGLLKDRSAPVQIQGLRILEAIGPPASSAWPVALRWEQTPNKKVPEHGIRALGSMGPGARGAIKQLERWARRHNKVTSHSATFALSWVDPKNRVAQAMYRRRTKFPIPEERVKAASDFRFLGFQEAILKDFAERMLKDPSEAVRLATLDGLVESPLSAAAKFRLAKGFESFAAKPAPRGPAEVYCRLMSVCGSDGARWLSTYLLNVLSKANADDLAEFCLRRMQIMGRDARGTLRDLKKAKDAFAEEFMKERIALALFVIEHADWRFGE